MDSYGEWDEITLDYYNYYFNITPKYDGPECATTRRINISEIGDYVYTGYHLWLLRLILPLILTTGLLTNLAFLYVVARVQSMRTVVNQYLVHLAVADMLFLVGSIGKKLWLYWASPVKDDEGSAWGPVVVTISQLLIYSTIFSSELLVTLVAFQRFYAVCRPVAFAANSNSRKVAKVLCLVWLICLGLAASTIPSVLKPLNICAIWPEEYSHFPPIYVRYMAIDPRYNIYTYVIQTVPFFVTMVINSVLYVFIMREMERRLHAMERYDLDLQTNVEIRNQVSRMLVANGIIFFILMAPFQFGSLLTLIDRATGQGYIPIHKLEHFLNVARMMVYLNSAINPLIYTMANSRYRAAFEEAFCQNRLKKKRCRRRCPAKQLSNHSSVYATSTTKASNSDSSIAGHNAHNGNETCV